MTELFIDLETYSSINLKKNSVYRYAEVPDFQILMAAYALDDDPVQVAIGEGEIYSIPGLWDRDVLKVAHNAQFERVALSRLAWNMLECNPGEYLDPAQYLDTQALAAEWGYPLSLQELAVALGTELKDGAGHALIRFFCMPRADGKRNMPEDHPEKWQQFVEYCRQDTVALREIKRALPDWPTDTERKIWIADQRVNDAGMPVDVQMATMANDAALANKVPQLAEVSELTGVENPNSYVPMMLWFEAQGVDMPDLTADTVAAKLLDPDLPATVRRVLELRQELALVASKKYTAMLERTNDDGRLRGAFAFGGAHTLRWAGRGVQLQNLPSATLFGKEEDPVKIDRIVDEAILDLKLEGTADAHTLKALVRATFVGPFTVVDYAAIEARVIAWLAAEQWALDAFAAGRDIYVETAERMSTKGSRPLTRKEGKVAVLALGFNGGINSLRVMGAEGSDEHLQMLVDQWRGANPNIASMWQEMDHAFRNGGVVGQGGLINITKDGSDRYVWLPSGRAIVYRDLKASWKTDKWGRKRKQISFSDPRKHGARTYTYGGKLSENVTQAVARDLLAEAIVRLQDQAIEVVAHVHDEILTLGGHSVERVSSIMTQVPSWADGLPVDGEGFQTKRYRKG